MSSPSLNATVRIRRALPEDAEACGKIIYDAFATINRSHNFPPELPGPEAAIGMASMLFSNPEFYSVVAESSGRVVGSTRYLALRPEHRSLEIGWTWLTPEAWGTGINVEAKLLMFEHAFEQLGCLRVELKTDAWNERSRGAMAALPAQFEGVHRKSMLVRGGQRRDSAWYSVIDDEWPEVRANLLRRLGR